VIHLLYGILKTPQRPLEAMAGLGGRPVTLISVNGLSAAVSLLPSPSPGNGGEEIMAYGRVVASLHCRQGIIPMRFGCCFADAAGIERLLRERRNQYETLLNTIAGKVEMGVNILTGAGLADKTGPSQPARLPGTAVTGSDYLQHRRKHYQDQDRAARSCTATAERYGRIFAGVCDRYKYEFHKDTGILSLYFLLPQEQVEPFRSIFAGLGGGEEERRMLSGPWPPYNFVC